MYIISIDNICKYIYTCIYNSLKRYQLILHFRAQAGVHMLHSFIQNVFIISASDDAKPLYFKPGTKPFLLWH